MFSRSGLIGNWVKKASARALSLQIIWNSYTVSPELEKNPFCSKKQNYEDLETPNTNEFICTDYVVHNFLCQILTTFHLSNISKCQELNFHCNFTNLAFFLFFASVISLCSSNKVVGNIFDLPCKEFPANIKPFCLELLAKGCIVNNKPKWQECNVFSYSHLSSTSHGICARWPIPKIGSLKYQLECKCLSSNVQNRVPCWFGGGSWMPASETITPMDPLKAVGGPLPAPPTLLYSSSRVNML